MHPGQDPSVEKSTTEVDVTKASCPNRKTNCYVKPNAALGIQMNCPKKVANAQIKTYKDYQQLGRKVETNNFQSSR